MQNAEGLSFQAHWYDDDPCLEHSPRNFLFITINNDPVLLSSAEQWPLNISVLVPANETRSRENPLNLGEAVATHPSTREPMTHDGQSQQDALRPTRPLLTTPEEHHEGWELECTNTVPEW